MEVLAKKYFSFIIALGAIFGLTFPSVGNELRFLVMPSLFILMIFTVLKIDFEKITGSIKKPIPLIVALLISYVVLPFLLYMLSDLLQLNSKEKLSVMFSILAPTILSAPYFVSIMKGDVEFSFVLSITITLLAPFLIPLELLYIFGENIDFPYENVFESIFVIVFIPIVILYITKKISPEMINKLSSHENSTTALMFFIFIWAIISVNASEILNLSQLVLFFVFLGVVQEFGFFIILRKISKLFMDEKMSKSFAFSIAIKNTALTAGVAMLSSNELALASSIVVLLHVPMFTWIMYKRDNI